LGFTVAGGGKILKKLSRFAVCLFVSFLFGGCSIFDLKNPVPPLENTQEQDPLNISTIIMAVTHEVTTDMDYRYYFTEDVTFHSFNFLPQNRDNILRMLDHLRWQASFVDWQIEKAKKRLENNRWIVTEMPYIVYSNGEQISSGIAEFHIIDRMISHWKDMPDDNANMFFEPY
jgi:xylose isomerase